MMTIEISKNQEQAWVIERALWRDYPQLQHIEKTCFSPDDHWPFWDLLGVLTLPGVVRLKAVVDDRMIGFISGERQTGRQIGWITNLAVLPEYRRQGIAQGLLSDCEEELGLQRICLSVRASNLPAINLYRSNGYQEVKHWKKYYAGGEDAIVLEKLR